MSGKSKLWFFFLHRQCLTLTFPFDIHLKWCSTAILWATSCCACPPYTFGGARFEPLLSLFACDRVLPCALGIKYPLVLLPHPSSNACTLTGSCCNHLVLSRRPSSNACTLRRTDRQSSCHHCWAAIVVGLPLLLGCHCHWAAIVVRLPLSPYFLGPICCWATLSSYSLGLPSNAPFVVLIIGLLS